VRISWAIPLLAIFLLIALPTGARASLDLMVDEVGLSLGNSPRVTGIRINLVDADVERVNGLNLTLWNPRPSPFASFNGLSLGVIGPKAGSIQGLAVGGIGATATDRIRGIAIGGFGAGALRLEGVALGGLLADIKGDAKGLLFSLVACHARGELVGLGFGGGFLHADSTLGVAIGGLATFGRHLDGLALSAGVTGFEGPAQGLIAGGLAAGGQNLSGIALSGGVIFANERIDGIAFGGLAVIAHRELRGIALSAGMVGAGKDLRGVAIGGFGVGTEGSMRGLAFGGLVSMAPEVTGISFGALNGVIIESINLDDFLKIRTVNQRYTGISLGLVNYSAKLNGVQVGLFNYAGNNPKWARLLPLINVHF
jgi:hypothetical protein